MIRQRSNPAVAKPEPKPAFVPAISASDRFYIAKPWAEDEWRFFSTFVIDTQSTNTVRLRLSQSAIAERMKEEFPSRRLWTKNIIAGATRRWHHAKQQFGLD